MIEISDNFYRQINDFMNGRQTVFAETTLGGDARGYTRLNLAEPRTTVASLVKHHSL